MMPPPGGSELCNLGGHLPLCSFMLLINPVSYQKKKKEKKIHA
jgi:hypothetical protein